jgi:hypothetical protein
MTRFAMLLKQKICETRQGASPSKPSKGGFEPFEGDPPERVLKNFDARNVTGDAPIEPHEIVPRCPDLEEFSERAAIIEYDGGFPRPFAGGLAAILTAGRPLDMPVAKWIQFQTDAALLYDRWGCRALELGWSPEDLLGTDPIAPWTRIDRLGLAWLLDGRTVMHLTESDALISGNARQVFRRKVR